METFTTFNSANISYYHHQTRLIQNLSDQMKWFAFSFLSQEQTGAPAMSNVRFIKINLEEAESGVESVMNKTEI